MEVEIRSEMLDATEVDKKRKSSTDKCSRCNSISTSHMSTIYSTAQDKDKAVNCSYESQKYLIWKLLFVPENN